MYSFQNKLLFVVLTGGCLLSGCINLKATHSYSASSLNDIDNFQRINYSFKRHCLDRCLDEAVRKLEIKRSLDCPCDSYIKADSITYSIFQCLRNYFSALSDLSDNKIISVNTDASRFVIKSGKFAGLEIDTQQVKAYESINRLLIKTSKFRFRKSNINEFLSQSNQPVIVLTNKFKFILENNLAAETGFRKEVLFNSYSEMKKQRLITWQEKARLTEDYYKQIADLDAISNYIRQYSLALSIISTGHEKLFEQRNNLSSKESMRELQQYAVTLDGMWSTLNHF